MLRKKEKQYLNLLRKEVWKKATKTDKIKLEHSNFDVIRKQILLHTGYALSRDTIKNFYKKKHQPAPQTLDIYSTFVLGANQQHPKTYVEFVDSLSPTIFSDQASSNRSNLLVRVISFLCLLILVFLYCYKDANDGLSKEYTSDFRDQFTSSNLEQLNQTGWFLFNDSINLDLWDNSEYRNNGYLTLETHLGDSHLSNEDYEPQVINILAKKINCEDCCEIEVKLVDFNPFQRYHQAGFYIFYDTLIYPSIRYCFAHDGISQAFSRNGKYSNTLLLQSDYMNRIYQIQNEPVKHPADSVFLKIHIENSEYTFSQKRDTGSFIDIRGIKQHLPHPAYIGLYASQGRPDVPFPVRPVAPVIPAKFEYVKVSPCE